MTSGDAKFLSEDGKQQQDRKKWQSAANALEEKKLHLSRKAKFGHLMRRKNIVIELMKDVTNINEVKENVQILLFAQRI